MNFKKLSLVTLLLLALSTPAFPAKQSNKILVQFPDYGQSAAVTFGAWAFFETARTIDAANEKVGQLYPIRTTGSIRKVHFRTGTVTTGATVDVRLETHSNTTGLPTGTLVGTNTNASQVINSTDDNTWFTTTLTADASVTVGDLIWIVIANPGASFGNMSFPENNTGASATTSEYHYYIALYGTGWAKGAQGCFQMILEYTDGSVEPYTNSCYVTAHSFTATTFNSGSTPDEYGTKFRLPFPSRVAGLWAYSTVAEDQILTLYDSDGTTSLGTCTLDKDMNLTSTGMFRRCFISPVNVAKDTWYRVSMKSGSTTNITAYRITTSTAALMDGISGGQNAIETTRTDSGSWSDTTTGRAAIGVHLDQFDDAVSAGGSGGSYASVS